MTERTAYEPAAKLAQREWFLAHDAYHKASETYNQRRKLVCAERERGNWSMKLDAEYSALHDAQVAASRADEAFYKALLDDDEQPVKS